MQCPSESEVAAISEGRDDKTTSVAKVLITVHKLGIDSSNEELILPIVPTVLVQLEIIENPDRKWIAKLPISPPLLPSA